MKYLIDIKQIGAFLVASLVFFCYGEVPTAHAQEPSVVIIANKSITSDQISSIELKKVFTGKKKMFSDGTKVKPVILKTGDVHRTFLETHVGKNENAFVASWKKLVFTGKMMMPKSFYSEEDLVSYTANTPDVIGYVSSNVVLDTVKTLTVVK